MIKAIIFDCFGVLTTDKWKEFCATLPEGPVLQAAHDLNHAYDAGLIGREEFLKQVYELSGRLPEDVEVALDNETVKNTELLDYIKDLKQQYKIGMISNIATNWIRDKFLSPSEQALFDDMVLSYEVNMTKPDPRIFKIAAERLGVEPNECIFVDDIEWYGKSAEGVGMKAITYESVRQTKKELQQILSK